MMFLATGFIAIAATKTALILGSTANIRPRVKRYNASTTGTPGSDVGVEVQVRRATALGTSTSYTLQAADPSDGAATPTVTAGTNCTVEPTYSTGALHDFTFNPRVLAKWDAYEQEDELILPATASNGIGWQIIGAGGGAGNLLVNADVRQ